MFSTCYLISFSFFCSKAEAIILKVVRLLPRGPLAMPGDIADYQNESGSGEGYWHLVSRDQG